MKIVKFGSFYVGGREISVKGQPIREVRRNDQFPRFKIDPNGDYIIEQAYVQYFIPENNNSYTIVLIHGGGLTGSIWETKPDGKDGWLHYFLSRGFTVYVIDCVERGRAGWCSIPGIWDEVPELRSLQRAWSVFRIGKQEDFVTKTPYAGSQFDVNYFDEMAKRFVPRWSCNIESSFSALAEVIATRIGKCHIVAHSHGSEISIRCAEKYPNYVKNLILIEPSGFPMAIDFISLKNVNFLFVFGDFIEMNSFYLKLFDHSKVFSEKLLSAGHRQIELAHLPALGIYGNTHVPMLDQNSDQIAKLISDSILGIKPCPKFKTTIENDSCLNL